MTDLMTKEDLSKDALQVIEIGCHHEKQHQELLYTDIKYILGNNPLLPKYNDEFEENFTDAQGRALRRLIAQLQMEFPNINQVVGHNDLPKVTKACPTFKVQRWIKQDKTPEKEPRKSLAQSKTIQASQITKIAGLATPLVGTIGGMDWQKLLILGGLAIVILIGTGVIDVERTKKWKQGDR